ncbi:CYTH domain-containing protein [Salipaludibacillus keqinensis]|uniref:CYTH domain-containing protein n=1 Tax=Salipaludibacillus keqinensis TaxID=2045207 RepID=UPI0013048D57|nr:CYTH domain-containing protein [Salipaludibacillus keqinensis]
MNQEIEIEFKNLINKDVYHDLLKKYESSRSPIFKQVNHYFDTDLFSLKAKGAALRVRYKKEGYILTLKQPHEGAILETHQSISESEFLSFKQHGSLTSGDVYHQLIELLENNLPPLHYLGYLTTERTEISLNDGLLVLDKSYYFDEIDYEIEFECTEAVAGQAAFEKLLENWKLDWVKPANKIERFYQAKQRFERS